MLPFLGLLHFQMNLKVSSQFYKKRNWNFDTDCIESADQLGEYRHLKNVKSSDPQT